MRLRVFILAVAAVATVASLSCGGNLSSGAQPDGGTRDGASDAWSGPDGFLVPDVNTIEIDASTGCLGSCGDAAPYGPCPLTAPSPGSACPSPGEQCEYGTNWWIGCNQVFRCSPAGTWSPQPPMQVCAYPDASQGCPATYAEATGIDAGNGMCPAAECEYAEGSCACLAACGGGAKRLDLVGNWYCQPATPECPSPRPDLGTACDGDGGLCQYGLPCGCGSQLACVGGVWRGGATPACP